MKGREHLPLHKSPIRKPFTKTLKQKICNQASMANLRSSLAPIHRFVVSEKSRMYQLGKRNSAANYPTQKLGRFVRTRLSPWNWNVIQDSYPKIADTTLFWKLLFWSNTEIVFDLPREFLLESVVASELQVPVQDVTVCCIRSESRKRVEVKIIVEGHRSTLADLKARVCYMIGQQTLTVALRNYTEIGEMVVGKPQIDLMGVANAATYWVACDNFFEMGGQEIPKSSKMMNPFSDFWIAVGREKARLWSAAKDAQAALPPLYVGPHVMRRYEAYMKTAAKDPDLHIAESVKSIVWEDNELLMKLGA